MNKFGQYLLVIGVTAIMFVLPLMAQSVVEPVTTVAEIHWMNDMSLTSGAEATLTRMEHGISMSFDTVGLEPHSIATVWWVIFDAPENCSDECGTNDVYLMDNNNNFIRDSNGRRQLNRPTIEAAQISNIWAAGSIVDEKGIARFRGHLPIGDTTGDTLFGSALQYSMSADVHLVLRTHGAEQPGLLFDQLLTGWGGCPDPNNRTPCADIQVAMFTPPQ